MSVFSEENRYVFGVFLVRMWENTDQKNSEYGHFLRSECSKENDNNDAKNKVKNELKQIWKIELPKLITHPVSK